jgi:hypothetical protein
VKRVIILEAVYNCAGSALTARLVVAMTTMPSVVEKPSICDSNCVSTDSLSSANPELELPDRALAT